MLLLSYVIIVTIIIIIITIIIIIVGRLGLVNKNLLKVKIENGEIEAFVGKTLQSLSFYGSSLSCSQLAMANNYYYFAIMLLSSIYDS